MENPRKDIASQEETARLARTCPVAIGNMFGNIPGIAGVVTGS